MKIIVALVAAVAIAGCAARAELSSQDDPIFRLQTRQIIERDLTKPAPMEGKS